MLRNAKVAVIFLSLFLVCIRVYADDTLKPKLKLQVGEELIYKVKYTFLTLGSLKFQTLEKDTINGRTVYHSILYIDSNPSLPFVNIHDTYETYIDEDIYSQRFIAWEKESGHTVYTRYDMNYADNNVHIIVKNVTETDTTLVLDSLAALDTPRKVQDGLSILYYARAMVKYKKLMSAPVFAYNELHYTFINFTGEQKKIEIDDAKYKAFYLDGYLKFVGIAGLKEGFKGWFSPDIQSVPLKAHMEAFIGHVTLQLDSYKNWELAKSD
jgi:Protein of unknown function (DUF3108)